MDIRNNKWFAQLQISGVGSASSHSGSIMSIVGEILRQLQGVNPRAMASGEREIVIRIRDKAFTANKDSSNLDRVLDIEAGLDESETIEGPRDNETQLDFVNRLVAEGLAPAAAEMIAWDWFDAKIVSETNQITQLQNWMNDAKAIRFRLLNSNNEAFESASPTEYAQLKAYVLDRFPTFCESLTFRTA